MLLQKNEACGSTNSSLLTSQFALHSSSFTLSSRRRTNKFIYTFLQKHGSISSPGILLSLGNILFSLHFQNTLSLQPN